MDTSFKNKKPKVIKELIGILGEENVSENPAIRSAYRGVNYGFMHVWGNSPEVVTMPRTVENVQEIIKLANIEKFTLMPICSGTITTSWEADVLVDMMGMDKIIKIDTENSYVVLEPGVTFNRLDPILLKEGYTIAHGSFPTNFSVAGNLGIRRGFNNNFSGRFPDQTLGFEIVTADGTLLKTGTATYGLDYWSSLSQDMPDLRGIFAPANQKMNLAVGIMTKAALRIWPLLEAQGLPIGGFDTYAKAMRFCKAVTKAGIADQSMVWNWVLVGLEGLRINGGDLDFLNYRMTSDYTKPYKGLHYCYTWTQFRGYKEQVDANLKVCERIAKEFGGKILSDSELQDTIPDMWELWKLSYKDFSPAKTKGAHLWRLGGEGMGDVWYFIGWINDLIKVEEAYQRRLKEEYHWPCQPQYSRIFESGIGGHLRFMPCVDATDEFQRDKTMKMREDLNDWVMANFPNVHCYGVSRTFNNSFGMSNIIGKVQDALDPNHIMYRPGANRLEPEQD